MIKCILLNDNDDGAHRYDLRTYDQRADARMDNHQLRIAQLEQQVSELNRGQRQILDLCEQMAEYISELRNAIKSANKLP